MPGRSHRRERVRHSDPARCDVPAAPGVRQGCARALPLPHRPCADAGRAGWPPIALGVRAARHARAGGRRFCLCAEAPRHHAHRGAGVRGVRRVRDRAEGLRRADQARGRQTAGRLAGRLAGQTVPRLPALAAGGRAGDRPLHVSHPPEGQVPAMALLDGDAVHGAAAVGGRCVLRAAGHGRGGAVAEPMADRHRAIHDAHLPARSTARAGAQPQLPRRHLSVRRAARRPGGGPAGRLRQAHALRRQAVRHDRERAHAAQGEVQAGLSRRA